MTKEFSQVQRAVYHTKRQTPGIVMLVLGGLLMYLVVEWSWFVRSIELLMTNVLSVGLLIVLFLLIQKFAFPKLDLQETIKNDSVAVALFLGFLVLAVATVIR